MSRHNVSYGAVWIRGDALHRGGDNRRLELVAALPLARGIVKQASESHPAMAALKQDRFLVVADSNPDFDDQVLESNINTGAFASFKLGDLGLLRLYSMNNESFSVREMNQLWGVIEIFTISINDALSHRRLREETEEREQIESQLRQGERLRAIGQLTGGVAHDFNNLLAVVMTSAELLGRRLEPGNPMIEQILHAVDRGAELTQRLLAFSRQQPLRSRPTDLAALIGDMSDLLSRTLGETIEIETAAQSELWPAIVDAGQVENALLNLCINARDAMENGGKLVIELSNAHLGADDQARDPEASVGDFVLLSVTDTGAGMSAEVRDHAFEPFFTTKEVGRGSGLGLSMVYGFAKQSGGHVDLRSEPGWGTTVDVFLPRAPEAPPRPAAGPGDEVTLGRGETVLVIEDDELVREMAVRSIEGLGYRVVSAGDAAAAWRIVESGTRIDVVLSDVVLSGGTSGPEFDERLGRHAPDLPVLFMSGYPADAAKRGGLVDTDVVLLAKPFRRGQLAKALHDALD